MFHIAIDGPGGAGKSTIAKAVAKKLDILYVDTGALYRTVGLFVKQNGVDPKDSEGVGALLPKLSIEVKYENGAQVVYLNGVNHGDAIRTPEMSMYASAVSAIPEVRAFLLDTQRDIAKKNSVVMDGRDIGTVVLPDAELKVYFTASSRVRAERRYRELLEKGEVIPKLHEHDPGEDWETGKDSHWHECECGEKSDEGEHEYKDGECVVCEMADPDFVLTTPDTSDNSLLALWVVLMAVSAAAFVLVILRKKTTI